MVKSPVVGFPQKCNKCNAARLTSIQGSTSHNGSGEYSRGKVPSTSWLSAYAYRYIGLPSFCMSSSGSEQTAIYSYSGTARRLLPSPQRDTELFSTKEHQPTQRFPLYSRAIVCDVYDIRSLSIDRIAIQVQQSRFQSYAVQTSRSLHSACWFRYCYSGLGRSGLGSGKDLPPQKKSDGFCGSMCRIPKQQFPACCVCHLISGI